MIREDYLRLMTEAAGSEYGIALHIGDPHKAIQARRKFYRLRERLPPSQRSKFAGLSFVVTAEGDLQILRRDSLPRNKEDDGLHHELKHLSQDELPDRFGYRNFTFNVRGRKKPPRFFIS